jgi:hypothetical protein
MPFLIFIIPAPHTLLAEKKKMESIKKKVRLSESPSDKEHELHKT